MYASIKAILFLSLFAAFTRAGEMPPKKWAADLVRDADVFGKPGVYTLGQDKLLIVAEGRVTGSLGEARAIRLARTLAESDFRRRLAGHLFPGERGVVALEIAGREVVSEKHVNGAKENRIYLGIAVDPTQVRRIRKTAAMVFAECRDLRLHPQVMEEMAALPTLLDGGGHIFESLDGWLAVGVGYAEIKAPGDSIARRDARKIARVNAAKELSEVVFGAWMQVMEADGAEYAETGAGGHFLDWSIKHTRETGAGEFSGMEEAGSWTTDDGELAMVVTLSDPRLVWDEADAGMAEPEVIEVEMEAEWREAFHRRPQWWSGGAGIAVMEGKAMAVAVGAAKLKGDAAYDRIQAPMAAEMDARRNFLKYFAGFSTKTVTDDVEAIREAFSDSGEATEVLDSLRKTSAERAAGAVRTMQKAGEWKSGDGKILYTAFMVDLSGPGIIK